MLTAIAVDFAPDAPRPRNATRLLSGVVTLLLALMCSGVSAPATEVELVPATAAASASQDDASVPTTQADAPSRRFAARRRRGMSGLRPGVPVVRVRSVVDLVPWRLSPVVPRLRRGPPARIV